MLHLADWVETVVSTCSLEQNCRGWRTIVGHVNCQWLVIYRDPDHILLKLWT